MFTTYMLYESVDHTAICRHAFENQLFYAIWSRGTPIDWEFKKIVNKYYK